MTDAHILTEKLSYQASHDMLTGLTNRQHFDERLRRVLDSARIDNSEHVLCYLDLDQFKIINDTYGHVAGDGLLRKLGTLLREQIRRRDCVARLGGDEFAVLVEHCSLTQGELLANSIHRAVEGSLLSRWVRIFSIITGPSRLWLPRQLLPALPYLLHPCSRASLYLLHLTAMDGGNAIGL